MKASATRFHASIHRPSYPTHLFLISSTHIFFGRLFTSVHSFGYHTSTFVSVYLVTWQVCCNFNHFILFIIFLINVFRCMLLWMHWILCNILAFNIQFWHSYMNTARTDRLYLKKNNKKLYHNICMHIHMTIHVTGNNARLCQAMLKIVLIILHIYNK